MECVRAMRTRASRLEHARCDLASASEKQALAPHLHALLPCIGDARECGEGTLMEQQATAYVPVLENRAIEATIDAEHLRYIVAEFGKIQWPARPNAFKSWYATESAGWTADIKVDYDFDENRPSERGATMAYRYLRRQGFVVHALRAYTTRKGLHLRMWVRALRDPMQTDAKLRLLEWDEILQIQEWLNDDARRRDFNQMRVTRLEQGWNVLWSEKWHSGSMISSECFDAEWTATFSRWFHLDVEQPAPLHAERAASPLQRPHGRFVEPIAHHDEPKENEVRELDPTRLVVERARALLERLDTTGILIAGEAEQAESVRGDIAALREALDALKRE